MVDALVSGASAERRVGSSPILGTTKRVLCGELFFYLIELNIMVFNTLRSPSWSNFLLSQG